MRCDEVGERLVELLYDEAGTPSGSPELRAHVLSCPSCRQELEDLRDVQSSLRIWKDEEPLRRTLIPRPAPKALPMTFREWAWTKYSAIAAMILLAFLAGFSFRALSSRAVQPDAAFYTRAEVRELLMKALDDAEFRMNETTDLKLRRALDWFDKEQSYMYLRLTANRNRN